MKKFLLSILPLVAVLFMGACTPSDGDGAKKNKLTVNVVLPDSYGYEWSDIANTSIIAKNQLTGQEFAANAMGEGIYIAEVVSGEYTVAVSMKSTDEKLINGSKSVSVYEDSSVSIECAVALTSPLVIKEFYTAMCKTPANKNYMFDQFVEIYNNSETVQYLDNCLIARTELAANTKNSFWGDNSEVNKEVAVSSYVAGWVGDGKTYPIEPGQSVVVAFQAQDHVNIGDEPNPNTVDLSKADYEINITAYKSTYVDNPNVPNLDIVAKPGTQSVNFAVLPAFGAGLVLAKVDNIVEYCDVNNEASWKTKPEGTDVNPYLMIKYKDIQDAINVVSPTETQRMCALGAEVDAGMVYPSAMYNGMGFTRKVKETINGRVVYQDTNNSTEDFEPEAKPTPGF